MRGFDVQRWVVSDDFDPIRAFLRDSVRRSMVFENREVNHFVGLPVRLATLVDLLVFAHSDQRLLFRGGHGCGPAGRKRRREKGTASNG